MHIPQLFGFFSLCVETVSTDDLIYQKKLCQKRVAGCIDKDIRHVTTCYVQISMWSTGNVLKMQIFSSFT